MNGAAPASEAEIAAAVARLGSGDLGTLAVVEPLARWLSREAFLRVLETLERRVSSGRVANDAGLLVQLLRVAVREQARRAREAESAALESIAKDDPRVLGVVERAKREDPQGYVEAMRGVRGFDVDGFLAAYVADDAERERLRGLAR